MLAISEGKSLVEEDELKCLLELQRAQRLRTISARSPHDMCVIAFLALPAPPLLARALPCTKPLFLAPAPHSREGSAPPPTRATRALADCPCVFPPRPPR